MGGWGRGFSGRSVGQTSLIAVLASGLMAMLSISAQASPAYQLQYQHPSQCPDSDVLQGAVAAHLGYSPFVPEASHRAQVTIEIVSGQLAGKILVFDSSGKLKGKRKLTSELSRCAELIESLALTLALAIDPLAFGRSPSSPPESSASSAKRPTKALKPAAPIKVEEKPQKIDVDSSIDFGALVSVAGVFATGPEPTLGLGLGGWIGQRRWQIILEGRAETPSSLTFGDNSSAEVSLLAGFVSPCYRFSPWLTCAVVGAGNMRISTTGLQDAQRQGAFWLSVGGRLSYLWQLSQRVELEIRGDLAVVPTEVTLVVSGNEVFTSSSLTGSIALAGRLNFL